MIYALVSDLFFADRVIRIAQAVSEPVQTFSSVGALRVALADGKLPDMLVIELPMLDTGDMEWLRGIPHVAGFGPHVDRERFEAAREQGLKPLWANSAMAQKLGPWIEACRA
jgi:hypothetical protein